MARRAAAILYIVPGLGFLGGTIAVLIYQDRRGELPMTPFGWRLLGSTVPGMGEDHLTSTGQVLAFGLIGATALDVVIGRWLWQGLPRGRVLGLATSPITFSLALLFQLPGLLIAIPLRVLLLLVR